MKRAITTLSLSLSLFFLASCETLTGVAPKGTRRVEVELAVRLDGLGDALVNVDPVLVEEIKTAALEEADLGLRFYPSLTEEYGESDQHPPYLMTVNVDSLDVKLRHGLTEVEEGEPEVWSEVDELVGTVSTSVERRRSNGPPLRVAAASAVAEVDAERDAERIESEIGYNSKLSGESPKVLKKDIVRAVRRALQRSLKDMRTAIDREFTPFKEESTSENN